MTMLPLDQSNEAENRYMVGLHPRLRKSVGTGERYTIITRVALRLNLVLWMEP